MLNYGNIPERILAKFYVDLETGCWIWTSTLTHKDPRKAYGAVWVEGGQKRAHRVLYELVVGPIPAGLQIDHLCRVQICVNPSHLESVTGYVNTHRGIGPAAINAKKTICVNGHAFDEKNTHYRVDRPGHRQCKECQLIWARTRNRKKVQA